MRQGRRRLLPASGGEMKLVKIGWLGEKMKGGKQTESERGKYSKMDHHRKRENGRLGNNTFLILIEMRWRESQSDGREEEQRESEGD